MITPPLRIWSSENQLSQRNSDSPDPKVSLLLGFSLLLPNLKSNVGESKSGSSFRLRKASKHSATAAKRMSPV
eukprot:2659724-Prymnesium_polylepis.1